MVPTHRDHQILPYSQGPAANNTPEFWRVHCQHTTAAAMSVRLLVPQLAYLTPWPTASRCLPTIQPWPACIHRTKGPESMRTCGEGKEAAARAVRTRGTPGTCCGAAYRIPTFFNHKPQHNTTTSTRTLSRSSVLHSASAQASRPEAKYCVRTCVRGSDRVKGTA